MIYHVKYQNSFFGRPGSAASKIILTKSLSVTLKSTGPHGKPHGGDGKETPVHQRGGGIWTLGTGAQLQRAISRVQNGSTGIDEGVRMYCLRRREKSGDPREELNGCKMPPRVGGSEGIWKNEKEKV